MDTTALCGGFDGEPDWILGELGMSAVPEGYLWDDGGVERQYDDADPESF